MIFGFVSKHLRILQWICFFSCLALYDMFHLFAHTVHIHTFLLISSMRCFCRCHSALPLWWASASLLPMTCLLWPLFHRSLGLFHLFLQIAWWKLFTANLVNMCLICCPWPVYHGLCFIEVLGYFLSFCRWHGELPVWWARSSSAVHDLPIMAPVP